MTINIWLTTNMNSYYLLTAATSGSSFYADTMTNFSFNSVKTYDVMNQQIEVEVDNYSGSSYSLWVYIYLMA